MANVGEMAKKEILELHKFFTLWFRGEMDKQEPFPFNARFDDKFLIYFPSGYVNTKKDLHDMVFNNHGSRKQLKENFTIFIDDLHVRWHNDDTCLVTYEERVNIEDNIENIRLSSALFQRMLQYQRHLVR